MGTVAKKNMQTMKRYMVALMCIAFITAPLQQAFAGLHLPASINFEKIADDYTPVAARPHHQKEVVSLGGEIAMLPGWRRCHDGWVLLRLLSCRDNKHTGHSAK